MILCRGASNHSKGDPWVYCMDSKEVFYILTYNSYSPKPIAHTLWRRKKTYGSLSLRIQKESVGMRGLNFKIFEALSRVLRLDWCAEAKQVQGSQFRV